LQSGVLFECHIAEAAMRADTRSNHSEVS
jgi:hypothetical protein